MELVENHVAFSAPRIGDRAPGFRAVTSKGSIYFPSECSGKWVILFVLIKDINSDSTHEVESLNLTAKELLNLNCELIGLSVDGLISHVEQSITGKEKMELDKKINPEFIFSVIADTNLKISKQYDIVLQGENNEKTVQPVYFIDPDAFIRAIIHFPVTLSRCLEEFGTVIIALQTMDYSTIPVSSNQILNSEEMGFSDISNGTAKDEVPSNHKELESCDCFFCANP
jgi:peroxiredoxin (alkyl hydroperoxide reductase subunit C)